MPSCKMKKGRFLNTLKNRPVRSALSSATENIPYAELGIRDIFAHKTHPPASAALSGGFNSASGFPHSGLKLRSHYRVTKPTESSTWLNTIIHLVPLSTGQRG